MATQANFVIDNHRRQRMIALGLSGVALVLSLAPRNERALFITPGDIKAFSAAVPTDVPGFFPINFIVDRTPSAFASPRSSNPAFGPAAAAPPGVIAPDPAFAGIGAPDNAPAAISSNSLPADSSGGSGFPFSPPGINPLATGPSAPIGQTSSTTGGTTTGGTTTGGTNTSTSGGIVPAVPEPATWSMLIVGFLFAGATLRRRQFSFSRLPLKETESN
ncbi:PEPxxWA-CTERM sorting domain-containing protein [Sphingomonas paeninsulae]|nr:PEPxxWA-CTERM sorting domain-containing protein [Sphingomonas paeninsulae]